MKSKFKYFSIVALIFLLNLIFAFGGSMQNFVFAESSEMYLINLNYSSFEDTYSIIANYMINEMKLSNNCEIYSEKLLINVNGVDLLPNYDDNSCCYEISLQKADCDYNVYAKVEYTYYLQDDATIDQEPTEFQTGVVKSETIVIKTANTLDETTEIDAVDNKIHIYTTATLITLPTVSLSLIALLCVYFIKIKKNFLGMFKFSFTDLKFNVSNSAKKILEVNVFGKKQRKLYKKILKKTNKLINKNIASLKQKNIESLGQYNSIILNCANLSKTVTAAEKTINKTTQAQSAKVLKYISNKSIPNIISNVNEVDSVLQRMKNMNSSSTSHKSQLKFDIDNEEYLDYLNKNVYNIADENDND